MLNTPWTVQSVEHGIVGGSSGEGVDAQAGLVIKSRRVSGELKFLFWLRWGSATSLPVSPWAFTLPIRLATSLAAPAIVVPAHAYDASAARHYTGDAILTEIDLPADPPYLEIAFAFGQNVELAGQSTPIPWATGDWLVAGNALEAFNN